jgi:hypothetical protein
MGKKTTPWGRTLARRPAPEHPFISLARKQHAQAVRRSSDAEFQSQIVEVKIKMLMAEDGEDATELLSLLAVVIGAPAQAGAAAGMYNQPWVRQLHGALRSIQDMCMHGYTWQARYALPLTRACEIAGQDQPEVSVDVFIKAWLDACLMSEMIMAHTVDAEAVLA